VSFLVEAGYWNKEQHFWGDDPTHYADAKELCRKIRGHLFRLETNSITAQDALARLNQSCRTGSLQRAGTRSEVCRFARMTVGVVGGPVRRTCAALQSGTTPVRQPCAGSLLSAVDFELSGLFWRPILGRFGVSAVGQVA
jgi:hypothetical protein